MILDRSIAAGTFDRATHSFARRQPSHIGERVDPLLADADTECADLRSLFVVPMQFLDHGGLTKRVQLAGGVQHGEVGQDLFDLLFGGSCLLSAINLRLCSSVDRG